MYNKISDENAAGPLSEPPRNVTSNWTVLLADVLCSNSLGDLVFVFFNEQEFLKRMLDISSKEGKQILKEFSYSPLNF